MIYKPAFGKMKDDYMFYHEGVFYLFSMYNKDCSEKYNYVHLATSKDGVHFEDYGCIIEDSDSEVWAMSVYQGEDAFYMGCSCACPNGRMAALKFWKSRDLKSWEYVPDADVIAPNSEDADCRLDCMMALKKDGKYYGYATGQYGFLQSDDGVHWTPSLQRIDYSPFPPYNTALAGFEIADFIEAYGEYYLFAGGFGHLGMNGYGVYIYKSDRPDGVFKPCLPYYRINGTSQRWVNIWERFFKKDGKYLACNYMYNGYSYENGMVYLPPIKELDKDADKLFLKWWDGNDIMLGDILTRQDALMSESAKQIIYRPKNDICNFSEIIPITENKAVIDFKLTLSENFFTQYSKGGFFLSEDEKNGSAVIFDTIGKCEIMHIKDGEIALVEDVISFGSNSLYYLESGKTYEVRVLTRDGMFEIYVNGVYLQTFNNAHTLDSISIPFTGLSAISCRNSCTISDVIIYEMNI